MLFHSYVFAIFFSLFLILLPLFNNKARIYYVYISSYVFYAWWYPPYLLVLLGLTLYAHVATTERAQAAVPLGWLIGAGLVPLAVFKYTGFALENLATMWPAALGYAPHWLLPLGISFVTFTAIAYVIDCRTGAARREPNFWRTALFIAYFPQLVAGPIMRARELMPQLDRIRLEIRSLRLALLLFCVGIFKKVVVADQIAPVVDRIYDGDVPLTAVHFLLAFYGFTVQIYCDFSGYTDMALGLAALLGVALPLNFDRPYAATSVRDFWRRWHMTLSRWLRDYLYVPLGGSRGGLAGTAAAAVITMLLGGLWHGASWTFVAWGALHGMAVAVEHVAHRMGVAIELPRWMARLLVLHFVGLGWILFRANGFEQVMAMFQSLAVVGDVNFLIAEPLVPVLVVAVFALHRWDNLSHVHAAASRLPLAVIVPLSLAVILTGMALSVSNPSAFIYFDF